jgi:hypothetical protein
MAEHTMRDDFNEAKQHAKEAVRASLMAARSALDFVLNKLDGDGEPVKGPAAGDSADRMTPDDMPPPPPPRDV